MPPTKIHIIVERHMCVDLMSDEPATCSRTLECERRSHDSDCVLTETALSMWSIREGYKTAFVYDRSRTVFNTVNFHGATCWIAMFGITVAMHFQSTSRDRNSF